VPTFYEEQNPGDFSDMLSREPRSSLCRWPDPHKLQSRRAQLLPNPDEVLVTGEGWDDVPPASLHFEGGSAHCQGDHSPRFMRLTRSMKRRSVRTGSYSGSLAIMREYTLRSIQDVFSWARARSLSPILR
jgi:hypothetical protein